jgi:N-acetylmuramoyl-L-alanine amidase
MAINRRLAEAQAEEGLKNNGVPKANYAVTRNPEIPSCLVEVDFITSPQGEEASWNPGRRRRVAAAIGDGFEDWAKGR